MKVGIVTLFNVANYGALLQAYGLYSTVKALGHEPILLEIPISKTNRFLRWIKTNTVELQFNRFIKEFLPNNTKDLTSDVDVYLVGSDQVWNPQIVDDKLNLYMLSFVSDCKPKYSYASSIGLKQYPPEIDRVAIANLLNRFERITIRETDGKSLLKNDFNIDSEVVLDPSCLISDKTSLLDKYYLSEASNKIVTYKLVQDLSWRKYTKSLQVRFNYQVLNLSGPYIRQLGGLHGFNVKQHSFKKWYSSIAGAKFVITDSFHGTIVSLLYNRQFVVIVGNRERFSRISSILSLLGLEHRIAANYEDIDSILLKPIDYSEINMRMDELVKHSMGCLREMLQ